MKEEMKIRGLEVVCYKDNIKIKQSYIITNTKRMEEILTTILERTTIYKSERTLKSLLKEWKFHNRLYKMHLFRKHTSDCDLESNQKLFYKIVYFILGI